MTLSAVPHRPLLRIALVGDRSPDVRAHLAIPDALAHAAPPGHEVAHEWIATDSIVPADPRLAAVHGIWCVPGSPYASFDGVLAAIRVARERRTPFLGTCGGFQHAVIEYARHVLGIADADHAETSSAGRLVITPLSCSLVGATGTIRFAAGSRVARLYGVLESEERYHCSYGVDPAFRAALETGGMRVTGVDAEGDVRVGELEGHPFYLGTLYQPELSSTPGRPAPVVQGFLSAAAERARPEEVDARWSAPSERSAPSAAPASPAR
jgi:CTP synthase (UTP-ammonia lyase)